MCLSSERAGRWLRHRTLWYSCKCRTLGKSCQSLSSHSECSRCWKTYRHKQQQLWLSKTQYTSQYNPCHETMETRDNKKNTQIHGKCCKWKHWLVFLQLLKVSCIPLRALKPDKERDVFVEGTERERKEKGLHSRLPYHCQHTSPTKRKLQSHTTSWWKHTSVSLLSKTKEGLLTVVVKLNTSLSLKPSNYSPDKDSQIF